MARINTTMLKRVTVVMVACIVAFTLTNGLSVYAVEDSSINLTETDEIDVAIAQYLEEYSNASIIYLYPVGVNEDGSIALAVDETATASGIRSPRNLVTIGLYMRPAGTRTYTPEVTYFGYGGELTYISITLDFGDGTYQNQYAEPPSGYYGWNLYYNNKTYTAPGTYDLSIYYGRIEVNDMVFSTTSEMMLTIDSITVT